jgi:CRISPR/Cas system CMR-associated protein Cmr1 (group 7 of RAMP superfamily)
MSKIKRIAVLTSYFRDANQFMKDNENKGIVYYHVTDIEETSGMQYDGLIKLYGWREIRNVDELIEMIKFRTRKDETN